MYYVQGNWAGINTARWCVLHNGHSGSGSKGKKIHKC